MDRRTLLTGGGTLLVAAALTRDANARARSVPTTPEDAKFMQLAIDQAKDADYPFGAIITRDDQVLALGHNSTKRSHDPTAHAEMMAIRSFLSGHDPEDFAAATIYASGEPCPMCMGAIIWCGFKRLVYAASIAQLSTKIGQIDVTARQIANATPFANLEISGGLLAASSLGLFSSDKNGK
jgi:tRNA(Arg) A34 adenosine deaminase TadA